MGQWPGSATNICLRIMELLNGRAARCGSARVVELVAAWAGGLCAQGCAVWQAPKRCTVASPPDKESPLGLSSCTFAARATTPADGATAGLLPSYLTQLPPRPCHSFASCISPSGPTTADDLRRPTPTATSQPAAYRSRYPHACPTRLPLARGPLFRRHLPAHHHPTHPSRHPIPSIRLCMLDSTNTANPHPASRAISSLITNPLHRILRRAYTYTYSPANPAHWRL